MCTSFALSNMGNCFDKPKNAVQVENVDNNVCKKVVQVENVDTNVVNACKSPTNSSGVAEQSKPSSHPLPTPTTVIQTSAEKNGTGILPTPKMVTEISSSANLKAFCFAELQTATRNFSPDILVGEGGFGYVYKGWLNKETLSAATPASGMVVAVKKLKPQGFQGHKEWLSEIICLGQLHHPNLVKLIGYCLEGENRLLVYEYMPKGSLENQHFRRAKPLPWAIRMKVAVGAARGLYFLHNSESQVIYRDFKSSNVLLDTDFNAKLSDFGLARANPIGNTHVSTEVMGTEGYCAPEYVATGRLTAKCDIYSFGVVLLELLTGRRAVDETRGTEQKMVDWVTPQVVDKDKIYRIMDSRLEGQYPRKAAYFAANLGLQCVHIEPKARPHMSDVLAILEKLSSRQYMQTHSSPESRKMALPPPTRSHRLPSRGSRLTGHTKSPNRRDSN